MNLKRHLLPLLFITALAICLLAGCGKNDTAKTSVIQKQGGKPLTKVTLNEVAHSIFYAPMYAAIENGYFEQEGIDLELVTGFGADKVMAAVLSGEADIGFMGPETTVYTYNEGASDAVVNFAQLTQRAGNFIVAREKTDAFQLSDLKGAEVLGGRAGGMPEMVFEYVLKKNGIKPSDVRIDQRFVVSSVGVESGYVPYTAFSAKKSYLDKNKDLIQSFTNALQKGMDYTVSHSSEEIAKTIQPQFSETDLDTLTAITERYHAQDTWKDDLVFSKESFELLLQILEDADVITKKPAYDTLVTTEFAEKAK